MADHDFHIVIPVADRPRQLEACLASLEALLARHPYAGRVEVMLADDSARPESMAAHGRLARELTRRGLITRHLDRSAQADLRASLPPGLQARLAGVIGSGAPPAGGHLGASVMRNLAGLSLRHLQGEPGRHLVWFVDSDQLFRLQEADGGATPDYLHALDRLFAEHPIQVLTGKVVGDPPVSPAVMARTLLDDLLSFLQQLAGLDPAAPCSFHGTSQQAAHGAYHDLADLFGLAVAATPLPYRCPLDGLHDHAACLDHLLRRLPRFFDGEHPTRSGLDACAAALTPEPARTVYTGNYVLTPQALVWFIPFADLRLRMAGPTLGRLLRAVLGPAFVSVSLPLRHSRTLEGLGRAEHRPGVRHGEGGPNLEEEFERQYYGDVLLFTVEALTSRGYPDTAPPTGEIKDALHATEAQLAGRYRALQAAVAEHTSRLEGALAPLAARWPVPGLAQARSFVHALRRNYGLNSAPWRRIEARRGRWLADLARTLARYGADRAAWLEALDQP